MARNTVVTKTPDAIRHELGYLSESEVCALLGFTLERFRVRQSQGDSPPFYKIGKGKLFRPADVDAWIKRQRVSRAST